MENYEETIFKIIVYAGEGKGFSYDALVAAEEGHFDEVTHCFEQADAAFTKAHKIQTEIIQAETRGEGEPVSLLMVHAQDQLMTAMESRTLIEHLVSLQKQIKEIEGE